MAGVGVGSGVGVGIGAGVGEGRSEIGRGSGTGVAEGVEAGTVEQAKRNSMPTKPAARMGRVRNGFIIGKRRGQRFRALNQSRKLLPVRLRKTSSKVVVSGSPTSDLRPRGVSRAISLPLSMMPMRSQRRSASSM